MNQVRNFKYGKIICNSNDQFVGRSISTYGQYCEEETQVFQRLIKKGDTVVEVGSNIGASTIPICHIVGPTGKVIAFEPQTPIFNMLCGGLALNNFNNAKAYNLAVGNTNKKVYLPQLNYNANLNFGGVQVLQQGPVPVNQIALDSFIKEKVDFIKIDVETMEFDVLEGGRQTIEKYKPYLFVENDRADKSQKLLEFIDILGYEMYWIKSNLFSENNYASNPVNVFNMNYFCVNILATPKGKEIKGLEKITDFTKWIES